MTGLQKVINATTYPLSYAYNLAGELTSITYPSTRVVQQSFDTIGRLCAVGNSGSTCSSGTTFATGFAYNAAFQVTGFNYGNGVSAAIGYTPDRLLLQSLAYTKGATTLFSTNYWYKTDSTNCPSGASGNNGQIQCITDTVDSGRSASYSYDALYRLTSAVTNGSTNYAKWGLSMTYDRYGNRLSQGQTYDAPPANSVSVSATTNHIIGSPYAYDASGNMTNDGNNTLVYDAENRALSATNGAASGTYTYDGNSLRVKKVSGGTTTIYIFSGTKVIAEYSGTSAPYSLAREYIYSGGALLAKIESGTTKYYHSDHLSNRLVTDSGGNTIAQLGHYPFGESWYNATSDKLLFTSYERDSESSNDYAMLRFGVNRLGRFSSPDPLSGSLGDTQTLNRYSYALNDPGNLADPSGLTTSSWWAGCAEEEGTSYIFCYMWSFMGEGVVGDLLIKMGPKGGGGGGLSKDQIIGRARESLLNALLGDPDCINFLAGRGADALNVLKNISIAPGDLGYYRFTAQTFNADQTPDGKAPTNPYIVINNQGFFFTSPNAIGFQGATLLHELGHATGVLVPDGVPNDPAATAKLQAHNDEALKTNCAKTLQTLGKP